MDVWNIPAPFTTALGNGGTVTSTATPRVAEAQLASESERSQGKEGDQPLRKDKRVITDHEEET